MKLGDVLKREREARRLSQEEVAKRVGIPLGDYQALEEGRLPRSRSSTSLLDKVAAVLQVDRNTLEATPDIE